MRFRILVSLAAIMGMSHALMGHDGPLQTGHVALDPRGFSPKPTPAPFLNVHRRQQLFKREDWTNTCAYVGTVPITCDYPLVCAYNTPASFMGCCSTDSGGQLLDPCVMTTSCVNSADSASFCAVTTNNCLLPATGFCNNAADPACITIILYAGAYTYSSLRCGVTNAVYTATSPSGPSSSPITTTTSSTSIFTSPTTTATTATTTISVPITSPTSSITADGSNHSDTGAIAGGVVGGVGGLALILGIVGFIMYRIRVKRREALNATPELGGEQYRPK